MYNKHYIRVVIFDSQMNEIVFQFGPVVIHAFTAWLMAGVAVGMMLIGGLAAQRGERLAPWLDVILGAVIGGVIGARAVHVWLNWSYFAAHTDQIANLGNGGLDWHGAVVVGLAGAISVALIRRVSVTTLTDVLALALPIGAIAAWQGCGAATCGYGLEVRTLADFPSWLVVESPDIYGTLAPRLNLPPIGTALAVLVLVIVISLTALRLLRGSRLWLAIALFSLGMGILDFFRAEYVPTWFDHRADQILDFALALVAILIFGITMVARRRTEIVRNVMSPA